MTADQMSAPRTARERARRELTIEIKDAARRQVAETGAPSLSLRAIARDLGMASSAIYRYFPSRDALLTALIIDAYDSIGSATEQAATDVARGDLEGRWMGVCGAIRRWALAHPHEYALIYGSPVPGYVAPADTADAATRTTATLLEILADASREGRLRTMSAEGAPSHADVASDLARIREVSGEPLPDLAVLGGLAAWMQVFGMVSFELFGHLETVIDAKEAHFEVQCRRLYAGLGIAEEGTSADA